jgi:hypothetical protein
MTLAAGRQRLTQDRKAFVGPFFEEAVLRELPVLHRISLRLEQAWTSFDLVSNVSHSVGKIIS